MDSTGQVFKIGLLPFGGYVVLYSLYRFALTGRRFRFVFFAAHLLSTSLKACMLLLPRLISSYFFYVVPLSAGRHASYRL